MYWGIFRHWKGRYYLGCGLARHSETGEEFVVYYQLYGDFSKWVRPKALFEEKFIRLF